MSGKSALIIGATGAGERAAGRGDQGVQQRSVGLAVV